MTTEQYAIGYEAGYQDGWNAAMEQQPSEQTLMDDEALLRQALEALEMLTDCYDDSAVGLEIDAIKALRAALAEQPVEQEPVAWMYDTTWVDGSELIDWISTAHPETTALPEEKPHNIRPLYTTPQPRHKLADEEIDLVLQKSPIKADYGHLYNLCRVIENAIWSKT
jgi:hypothetical protein